MITVICIEENVHSPSLFPPIPYPNYRPNYSNFAVNNVPSICTI